MPIYEYSCKKCASVFEKLVYGSSSEQAIPCLYCQSTDTEQLFSCFNGVSRGSDGSTHSMSSGCSSCHASSCSSCKSA
ncbi:MAG TPA: FmdB family zinc ribbon protein [Acidobacteriota bacterium]|nr:FmdB family zinc ribbon protein [Acidobacteriota bacterium]